MARRTHSRSHKSKKHSKRHHRRSTHRTRKHRGGSVASDLVNAQLTGSPVTQVVPDGCPIKANMDSLNLYNTTGGGSCGAKNNGYKATGGARRRRRSSKKFKKSKSRRGKMMRGGGSDWIMSQYSQGNINAPESDAWKQFGAAAPSARADLMNPPTMGLAGSGYPMGSLEGANTRHIGAPVS